MSTAVHYALSDFVTGSPILDLPVMQGASWSTMLNAPDALSCTVDMRDRAVQALDLRSSSSPKKAVLSARTDDDVVLAWGIISSATWNNTKRTVALSASGFWQWLNKTIIGPASARTALIVNPDGSLNTALDTAFSGYSLGTIGKLLVQQRLTWPGSPALAMPANQIGTHERTEYYFALLKSVGAALTELTQVEGGPDFAFDAARGVDGLSLVYSMRHGSEENPRLGTKVGSWGLGSGTPIDGLDITDNGEDFATAAWMIAGRTGDRVVASRLLNDSLITDAGYPSTDYVDTSRSDVSEPATLDKYNAENAAYAGKLQRDLTFKVRGNATPGLGQYRPGDTVDLSIPADHPWLTGDSIPIRILGMSGDETGESIDIDSVVLA